MRNVVLASALTLFPLCAASVLRADEQPASFGYVLQADRLAKDKAGAVKVLAECDRDWIILDASYLADGGIRWTKEDLKTIRAGKAGRKVIAYLSIGEAEEYRWYWQDKWNDDPPEFLLNENPDWPGNYGVRYWMSSWKRIILREVDTIMAQGFDGLYLDKVDLYEDFEFDPKTKDWIDHRPNPATGNTYREDMIAWVQLVASQARQSNQTAMIVPQNASPLLDNDVYLRDVNAIGIEDLFTDGTKKQPKDEVEYIVEYLDRMKKADKPVLCVEYPTKKVLRRHARESSHMHGFRLLITDRDLTTIGEGGGDPVSADFQTYDKVDHIVVQDASRFATLLNEGNKRVVRLALFGDSQETAPGGGGRVYIPRLNYELFKHFGNSPETLIEPVVSAQYAWLQRSANLAGKVVDLGNRALPGVRVMELPHKGNTYLVTLQHSGEGLLSGTLLAGEATEFFSTDGIVKAEIFAMTRRGSGSVRYEAKPHDGSHVDFYAPVTTTGTLALNLDVAEEGNVTSATTVPLDFAGKKYTQLQLRSAEPGTSVQIVGLRFINEAHARGVVINDFSQGGYQLASHLESHRNAGDMFRAFNFDAAVLHLGANDTRSASAPQFKKHTEEMIAVLRGWMNDPDYKIILMGDPDMKTHANDQAKRAAFDRYPGAQAAIAMADANVMVINSRRIADEKLDWRLGHPKLNGYLHDEVHYSTAGGRVLAEVEMNALLEIVKKRRNPNSHVHSKAKQ